jgi:23S rRNA (pseudouridine1915-N3)-methyltransferase
MRLSICAIGRLRRGPETELLDDYLKRARALGRSLGITEISIREIPESRASRAEDRVAEEAARLLDLIPSDAFAIALDERGKTVSSRELASAIGKAADDGAQHLAFLIGGPDGHGAAVASRANLTVSFGRLTWPHRLVRLMLAEQVYRSFTILANHPYHRD